MAFAMYATPAAMSPKPNVAPKRAMIKNVTVHFSIYMFFLSSINFNTNTLPNHLLLKTAS